MEAERLLRTIETPWKAPHPVAWGGIFHICFCYQITHIVVAMSTYSQK